MHYKQINSIEDAYQALGLDPATIETVKKLFEQLPEQKRAHQFASYILPDVVKAFNQEPNGEVFPDYTKWQSKYELWPIVKADTERPAGFGLSYDDCGHPGTFTHVGSRLCFRDRERAKLCFEKFTQLWVDLMTGI